MGVSRGAVLVYNAHSDLLPENYIEHLTLTCDVKSIKLLTEAGVLAEQLMQRDDLAFALHRGLGSIRAW